NNDAAATTESAAVVIKVITNDTDVDGTIDPATVDLNTTLAGIQASNTITAGTFTASATGDVTFTPTGTFSGVATLGYRVNDNSGGTSNTATISVTVTAVNDPPVAVNDAATTNEDIAVNINVVSNDSDEDGSINPSSVDLNTASAGIQNSNVTTSGTFTVNAGGVVNFAPAANFTGTVSVDYTVNDNVGLTSNVATITITVNPVNDAPVAGNDAVSTNEDTPVTFNILDNDVDVDGTINPASVLLSASTSSGGSFTVTAGAVTFTPNANFSGVTFLTYRVKDNLDALSNSATITVTVNPVNDPPSFNEISDQRVLQNSGPKNVSIIGISPGPLESEQLLINATSGNTSLIPHPTITYNGTAATATLSFTPAAGQSGVADITVKIVDTGLNEFTRQFQIEVLEVNIISDPATVIAPLQLYTYNIALTANLPETLTIVATQKPAWLTLSSTGVNTARLQGTPPANALHLNPITIQVKSGATVLDEQSYTLIVNRAPAVSTFSFVVNEDVPANFTQQDFAGAFTDVDNNTLSAVKIVSLPESGTVRLNGAAVAVGQEIGFVAIPNLSYLSAEDFVGSDTFTWTGSDGFAYSTANASVNITINPVNDGPRITVIETDSLRYDLGSDENVVLTPLFDAIDIDDTMLTGATIGFRPENFRPGNDELIFFNTSSITGVFDELSGILTLTGVAPTEEYVAAIRNINYRFNDFSEIIRETKSVYFTLTDGKTPGETKERHISLIYTFEPLDIPNAFTPGGNDVNELWKVTDPDGTGFEQYSSATIQVYTKRGTLVYEATGLDKGWDGTFNGEILPADTYYYIIDLKYNKIVYKGVVLILR
ncbi:MAG TPA: tandem-95 repeat protein, partial [Ohtaekwangia sp.]|nr:tandem-95 repeat protein [Ohtaekwangia sp.]